MTLEKETMAKLKKLRLLSKQKNKDTQIALYLELGAFLDNFSDIYYLDSITE
jgi:hypothetical protein